MQRHDVASTLRRRCINVMCLLGYLHLFPREMTKAEFKSANYSRVFSTGSLLLMTFVIRYWGPEQNVRYHLLPLNAAQINNTIPTSERKYMDTQGKPQSRNTVLKRHVIRVNYMKPYHKQHTNENRAHKRNTVEPQWLEQPWDHEN